MSMIQYSTRLLVLVSASIGIASAASGAKRHEAFLTVYCIHCHGPDNQEGELRIVRLSRDFELGGESHRWAELLERVNSGEMPPGDEPQPTQDESAAFVTKLDSLIRNGRAARMAARPSVAHYRLSRKEYQSTVYDLLGVRYDPTQPGESQREALDRLDIKRPDDKQPFLVHAVEIDNSLPRSFQLLELRGYPKRDDDEQAGKEMWALYYIDQSFTSALDLIDSVQLTIKRPR